MNIKKLTGTIAAAALVAASASASADTWTGTITHILSYTSEGASPSGAVYLILSSAMTGGPGCATQTTQMYVDTSTVNGSFIASQALTAELSGASVTLTGSGTCFGGSATEYVSTFRY